MIDYFISYIKNEAEKEYMLPTLRQAGLSLCLLVGASFSPKEASASVGYTSLNCVLKLDYTVKRKQKLNDVVNELYRKTTVWDTQGHPQGNYPTRLRDMERYQAAVSFLNNMDLSMEVQPGQKLVLPYGGSLVCKN